MDRLLRIYGSDRKQHEQELVAWIDGTTVTRCPCCTSTFNLTRRQHHCRLCGSIMCNSCSYFLTYEAARKYNFNKNDIYVSNKFLESIVAPVNNPMGGDQTLGKESESLRICTHCLDMLENRRKAQIEQMIQPIICQLYSHLQNNKQHIQNSVDMYYKVFVTVVVFFDNCIFNCRCIIP